MNGNLIFCWWACHSIWMTAKASLVSARGDLPADLGGRYNIEVIMVDERLTSREAKSMLQEEQRNSGRGGQEQGSDQNRSSGGGTDTAELAAGAGFRTATLTRLPSPTQSIGWIVLNT